MDASTIINDYSKTMITLASALLVFTGSFLDPSKKPTLLLLMAWVLLLLAIGAAAFAIGRLASSLRTLKGGDEKSPQLGVTGRFANLAMLFFVLAILLFLGHVIVVRESARREPPVTIGAKLITKFTGRNVPPILRSLRYDTERRTWILTYRASDSYYILELKTDGDLISYEQLP